MVDEPGAGTALDTSSALVTQLQEVRRELGIAVEALELLHDDDPRARRRLRALRARDDYDEPFSSPDPLVSVVIPTWNRVETLIDRAIPSALRQTHRNLEVIVVGDASPSKTAEALAALDDGRVSFNNLTLRGPYHEDPRRAWTASGTPPYNAGVALAHGLWIAPLGDDDEFVPNHVEQLLTAARERRLEFVYGRLRMVLPNGSESVLGEFPPCLGQIGLQAALYHRGLKFMELELAHSIFAKPNDWGLVHRMMRAGVRMGMVDETTVSYWPSLRAHPGHETQSDSSREQEADQRLARLIAQVQELEQRLAAEHAHSEALGARLMDLDRRLAEVRESRSWRMTGPLRALRGRFRRSA